MKLILRLSLFIFALLIISDESFSLTNYEIKRICKNERKKLTCMKKLQEKKSNLQKGDVIEIPVIPFRG
tara:strand:+ start:481 stop:687 length:207 start_codon:yes stop_codon:yes gene_type:complete